MMTSDVFVLGIDLGGTKTRIGIVSQVKGLLRAETKPTPAARGPEGVLEQIRDSAQALLATEEILQEDVMGAGLGAPGPLDRRAGIVSIMPNLPGWEGFPLRDRLTEALRLPAVVVNDADAAALGEFRYGAGRGAQDMVYLALGTGVGGGIIAKGQLYSGVSGAAAEVGHIVLDPEGPLCGCGHRGCLEAYCSGSGLERLAEQRLQAGASSTLRELAGEPLSTYHLEKAARAGDALARELFEQGSRRLAQGIVTIVHLLNPELLVFGGGLLALSDLLIEPAIAQAEQRMLQQHRQGLRFVYGQLGDDAGVLGAAALALETFAQ